jgi:hypothetical protein
MALTPHLDIPRELALCVRGLGGVLLDDEHGPEDPSKADYWFPSDLVVAELKLLSKNYFDDQNYKDWLRRRYDDWVNRRLAPVIYGSGVINLGSLPTECGQEVISFLRDRLDRTLKQANSQIKTTRTTLGVEHAQGLVILVNDGNVALPPGMVVSILARSLRSKFSAINGVVHFSANMRSELQGIDKDLFYWCNLGVGSVRPAIAQPFMERLREAWIAHHAKLLGEPMPIIQATKDDIYNMHFMGPAGAI